MSVFTPSPYPHRFFRAAVHTHKILARNRHLLSINIFILLSLYEMTFWPYSCSLHTNIIKKRITTTSFQHTETILSLYNQISTFTTTSLQHLKSQNNYFLLLHIKLYEKQVSLINKLQSLSLPINVQYKFTLSPSYISNP